MVKKITNTASKNQKQCGETANDVVRRNLKTKIKQLRNQVNAERGESIKEKVKAHWDNLGSLFSTIKSIISMRKSLNTEENVNILSSRINQPFAKFNSFLKDTIEKDYINNMDCSSAKSTNIPHKEKIPPYTSWVYVARNERMAKDQTVLGKYQMYYDKCRGEMMICSDSEEEIENPNDIKYDFTEIEDQILRLTLEEYESTEVILNIVKETVKTTSSQIQERYEILKEENMRSLDQYSKDCHCKGCQNHLGICLEEILSAILEPFDEHFCRRCLIFDCPVHGINQPLIYPSEKQPNWYRDEGDRKPCSDQCYIMSKDVHMLSENTSQRELGLDGDDEENHIMDGASKKLTDYGSCSHDERDKGVVDGEKYITNGIEFNQMSISKKVKADDMTSNSNWRPLERDLFLKGAEMFGKNSCFIAFNLLVGLRTCLEINKYMFASGDSMTHGSLSNSIMDQNENINTDSTDQQMSSRSRSQRKKGKPKKFNYSRKSVGLPPRWRKIAYGQNQYNKQYTPCECQGMCGKECPCLLHGTCCEKYCGCLKLCNNRFRGCRCTKSQCKSRLCPCFAANRECDPDVCRNCLVSCGDGSSLGESSQRGDSKCGNMNLLLGQKERILLSRSDVIGWGAFSKNPINKNVCLGEYTGELITPKEAEKRGKLYDRVNTSFLFNLNDRWVIDSCRRGDKLKFANHSSRPNCYAKVMLVKGDHRVGIFSKENIEAGDEIFYDYWYDLDCAPQWALPPDEASKKDESNVSHGRAKKNQSRC